MVCREATAPYDVAAPTACSYAAVLLLCCLCAASVLLVCRYCAATVMFLRHPVPCAGPHLTCRAAARDMYFKAGPRQGTYGVRDAKHSQGSWGSNLLRG